MIERPLTAEVLESAAQNESAGLPENVVLFCRHYAEFIDAVVQWSMSVSRLVRELARHAPPGQVVRFLIVGAWNTLFAYGLFALLTYLSDPADRVAVCGGDDGQRLGDRGLHHRLVRLP